MEIVRLNARQSEQRLAILALEAAFGDVTCRYVYEQKTLKITQAEWKAIKCLS